MSDLPLFEFLVYFVPGISTAIGVGLLLLRVGVASDKILAGSPALTTVYLVAVAFAAGLTTHVLGTYSVILLYRAWHAKMPTVLDEFTRQALAVTVRARIGASDILEALYSLLLRHSSPEYIRSELPMLAPLVRATVGDSPRVRRRSNAGLASTRWHQTDPHLPVIALGERKQRTVQ